MLLRSKANAALSPMATTQLHTRGGRVPIECADVSVGEAVVGVGPGAVVEPGVTVGDVRSGSGPDFVSATVISGVPVFCLQWSSRLASQISEVWSSNESRVTLWLGR